jgi:hypothetical protein
VDPFPRTYVRTYALWIAFFTFLAASLLPVWTVWPDGGRPVAGSLWTALAWLVRSAQTNGLSWDLLDKQVWNLELAAGALVVGYGLGWLDYRGGQGWRGRDEPGAKKERSRSR